MLESKKAPFEVTTARLVLRKPVLDDAEAIFRRYASDHEALKYMGWSAHESTVDTRSYLEFAEKEWQTWPAGPYLILSPADGLLLGGTGLAFEAPEVASTGYVLARDSWGKGYATEALLAVVAVSRDIGVRRLIAYCHTRHRASAHVLEKAGFTLEATLPSHQTFPNLGLPTPQDVFLFAIDALSSLSPADRESTARIDR